MPVQSQTRGFILLKNVKMSELPELHYLPRTTSASSSSR